MAGAWGGAWRGGCLDGPRAVNMIVRNSCNNSGNGGSSSNNSIKHGMLLFLALPSKEGLEIVRKYFQSRVHFTPGPRLDSHSQTST